MAESRAPRVLLCGDVLGRLHQLFKRATAVNKSNGPFDFLLCVGPFFPNPKVDDDQKSVSTISTDSLEILDFIARRADVPIPTYFIGDYGVGADDVLSAAAAAAAAAERGDMAGSDVAAGGQKQGAEGSQGLQICHNLWFLDGAGVATISGLRIGFLSGIYKQMKKGGGGCISLGKEDEGDPPVLIKMLDGYADPEERWGSFQKADVEKLLSSWERCGTMDILITNMWPRGVLTGADLANLPSGIDPIIAGCTMVSDVAKHMKPRYHIAGTEGVFYAREPYSSQAVSHVTRFIGLAAVGNSVKQVEAHLVVSIGESCYCTVAKGALVPEHVLVLPIEHFPSILSLPAAAFAEVKAYKHALERCFKAQGKDIIVFERFLQLRMGTHCHLQIVAVPENVQEKAGLVFQNTAAKAGVSLSKVTSKAWTMEWEEELRAELAHGNYFWVELPDHSVLFHAVKPGDRLPLQFGREAVAELLDMPERADWKACKQTREQETEVVNGLKAAFKPFDDVMMS